MYDVLCKGLLPHIMSMAYKTLGTTLLLSHTYMYLSLNYLTLKSYNYTSLQIKIAYHMRIIKPSFFSFISLLFILVPV